MQLIDAIKREQADRKLNDAELSRLLGFRQSVWSRIKRGERKPGLKFLTAIRKSLPNLKPLIWEYEEWLSEKKDNGSKGE